MPEVFTQSRRSEVMSLIRSRGNKGTELKLIALMQGLKITDWREHGRLRDGRGVHSTACFRQRCRRRFEGGPSNTSSMIVQKNTPPNERSEAKGHWVFFNEAFVIPAFLNQAFLLMLVVPLGPGLVPRLGVPMVLKRPVLAYVGVRLAVSGSEARQAAVLALRRGS